jgi:membrane peptidoglycan carboxypeptidase
MQNILSDDVSRNDVFGQGGAMTIPGYPASNFVAAKTGTSNDARDLWTMGFTKNAVVGVWLGRHDDQATRVTAASVAAAPVWQRVMQYALSVLPNPALFTEVAGIQHYDICVDTGTQNTTNCSGLRSEIFIGSQPPPGPEGAFVRQVEIDTWTGLLANEYCPNNKAAQTFVNITDQAALNWLNGAGKALAQRYGITDQALPMPTAACDTSTEIPIALFNYPSEGVAIQGPVNITGSASATTTFSRYQIDAVSPTGQVIPIAGPVTTPVQSGTLGSWDTRGVANGAYTLRLQMFANNTYAGYLTRQITVNVNNPTPTSAPVLPTSIPLPTLEPLPFDPTSTPEPLVPGT